MKRKLLGIVLIIASLILLLPTTLVFYAPFIARVFFHGSYSITADTEGLQEEALAAMACGAGLVGGVWLLRSSRKQKSN